MIEEATDLLDKEVFTHKGVFLGVVVELVVDEETSSLYELVLAGTNPELVDGSRDISIPFRWVKSISDIIVLKYFPGKVTVRKKTRGKKKLRVTKSGTSKRRYNFASGVREWH